MDAVDEAAPDVVFEDVPPVLPPHAARLTVNRTATITDETALRLLVNSKTSLNLLSL